MRSVPENMPQCLLQEQQLQSSDGSKQNSTMSAKYDPHVSSQHYFKISRNLTLKTSIFDSLKLKVRSTFPEIKDLEIHRGQEGLEPTVPVLITEKQSLSSYFPNERSLHH